MTHSLYPQRLTPFEFYFLLEDRPGYPSNFPIRLECRGPIDREAFERAFQSAHARHPFLSARIERDGGQWPTWMAGEPSSIRWTDKPDFADEQPIATSLSAGLQTQVSRNGDKTVISFLFPHIATDGMGAFQFISDLMVAYAHDCTGDVGPPPWRPLDLELLRDRDGHHLFNRRIKVVDLIRVAKVMVPLLIRRAAVISDHDHRPPAEARESSEQDFALHSLTEEETARLTRVGPKAICQAERSSAARLLSDARRLESRNVGSAPADAHPGAHQSAEKDRLSNAGGECV